MPGIAARTHWVICTATEKNAPDRVRERRRAGRRARPHDIEPGPGIRTKLTALNDHEDSAAENRGKHSSRNETLRRKWEISDRIS
jgi:hypothetical protein